MGNIKSLDSQIAKNGRERVKDYVLTSFGKGQKLPTVGEIAKQLGTTQYAAERVLTELSAEGIVKRKPRYGTTVVGQKDQASATPPVPRIRTIAFMADELESFLSSEIMRGVEAFCRNQGISMILLNSDYCADTERTLIDKLLNEHLTGAIVRVGEHMENMEILEESVPSDFPLLLVDRSDEDTRFPCVKMDQVKASYTATKHLLDLGHRRIAHITYDTKFRPLLKEMKQRKEGYVNALHEAGIPMWPEYVQEGHLFTANEKPTKSYFEALGYAPMNRLLLQKERPSAVFLLHFYFVFGVLKAIEDHNLRVPEDISVICIDDETVAPHLNPPITVYAQPLREIGAKAAELLMDASNGIKVKAKRYHIEGRLIRRGSTAPVNEQG